jgi:NADH-quinone oxidoreductase subunit A
LESTGPVLWPFAVYLVISIGLVALIIVISYYLGERHQGRTTDEPYESGAISQGSAQQQIDISYYLIAVFFVIFDVEAIFIFSWAVDVRNLGWLGYLEILIFIIFLLMGLAYLWLTGALDPATMRQKSEKIMAEDH